MVVQIRMHLDVSPLGLIGNVSAPKAEAKVQNPSRDVSDKETRRKLLVFAADTYGNSMCFGLGGVPRTRSCKGGKMPVEGMEPRMRYVDRGKDCRF